MAEKTNHFWFSVGSLMVTFTTSGQVSNENWDQFLQDLRSKPIKSVLGSSIGLPTLNSVQRKQLAELLNEKGVTLAALTDERMVRGVATAMSWFGVKIKAFSWADLRDALEYLGADRRTQDVVVDKLTKLRQQAK